MEQFILLNHRRFGTEKLENNILHNGVLYTLNKTGIFAWRFETGELIWQNTYYNSINDGCMWILNDFLIVYSKKYVYEIDLKSSYTNNNHYIYDKIYSIINIKNHILYINYHNEMFVVDNSWQKIKQIEGKYKSFIHCEHDIVIVNEGDNEIVTYNVNISPDEHLEFKKVGGFTINNLFGRIRYYNGLFYIKNLVHEPIYTTLTTGEKYEVSSYKDIIKVYDKKGNIVSTYKFNDHRVFDCIAHNRVLFVICDYAVYICYEGIILNIFRVNVVDIKFYKNEPYFIYRDEMGMVRKLGEYFPRHFTKLSEQQHKQVDTWVSFRDQTKTVHKDISFMICRALLC